MGHEVFEWVIAMTVLGVFISNLAFLWLFYVKVKPLIYKLQATSDRLNPILLEAQEIMGDAKGMVADIKPVVTDVGPVVRNIVVRTNDITDMVHSQATQIRMLMQDNITRMTDQIDTATGDIEKKVIEPIVTTMNDANDMVRVQIIEFRTLMQDIVFRMRDNIDQLDDLIRRANSRIDDSITNIERQLTSPVREVNYMEVAVKKGLSALFDRDKANKDKTQVG